MKITFSNGDEFEGNFIDLKFDLDEQFEKPIDIPQEYSVSFEVQLNEEQFEAFEEMIFSMPLKQ